MPTLRELATVATSTALGQLSSIEILARHRELCGYETLDELEAVLTLCGKRPSTCHVVLNGPDTLLISQFEPAIDFLVREVGFQLHRELVKEKKAKTPGNGTRGTGGDTESVSGVSTEVMTTADGGASRRKEYVSLVMPRPPGWPMDTAPPVVKEDSADWLLFKRRITRGIELVKWAKWANTSLLSIKLTDVLWYRAPSTAYGFEVKVKWRNQLGKECGQIFEIENRKYHGTQPSVCEIYDTTCETACTIVINVYRDRMLLPKFVGKAELGYDNRGVTTVLLDIADANYVPPVDDAPPKVSKREEDPARRGCLRLEVGSIRHRYTRLQEDLIMEAEERRQQAAADKKLEDQQMQEERKRQAERMKQTEKWAKEAENSKGSLSADSLIHQYQPGGREGPRTPTPTPAVPYSSDGPLRPQSSQPLYESAQPEDLASTRNPSSDIAPAPAPTTVPQPTLTSSQQPAARVIHVNPGADPSTSPTSQGGSERPLLVSPVPPPPQPSQDSAASTSQAQRNESVTFSVADVEQQMRTLEHQRTTHEKDDSDDSLGGATRRRRRRAGGRNGEESD
jgi:hypothetical protein